MGPTGTQIMVDAFLENDMACLEQLYICRNRIYAEGACHLARLCDHIDTIQVIDVSSNNIVGKGLHKLFDGLMRQTCLEKINISDNTMKAEEIDARKALAHLIKTSRSLKTVNISDLLIEDTPTQLMLMRSLL